MQSRRLGVKVSFFFLYREARQLVILSAAGAKDLLALAQRRRTGFLGDTRARDRLSVPGRRSVPKQVLRSRASRALAQDDSRAALMREKEGEIEEGSFSIAKRGSLSS
jgi:hypothetical protein